MQKSSVWSVSLGFRMGGGNRTEESANWQGAAEVRDLGKRHVGVRNWDFLRLPPPSAAFRRLVGGRAGPEVGAPQGYRVGRQVSQGYLQGYSGDVQGYASLGKDMQAYARVFRKNKNGKGVSPSNDPDEFPFNQSFRFLGYTQRADLGAFFLSKN
jgi:hypothetical protein